MLPITDSPSSPSISQIPQGSVDENDLIVLTCEIIGGNPPATIVWTCSGTSPVNNTGIPPTNKTVSSVQLTAAKIHDGQVCTCTGSHLAWTQPQSSSITLQIRYSPTSSPDIKQIPSQPVIEGNKVTLTCEISGGNPLPTMTWQCDNFANVVPVDLPPANRVVSSIERVVTRLDNGKICICIGQHPLWTPDKQATHIVIVYYLPASPSITQIPQGSVDEKELITLTCEIIGGNPPATIVWQCSGTSLVNPTGIPTTNKTVSSVQLTAAKIHDGQVCTCTGSHPAWTQTVSSSITLQIRYVPTSFPVVTQTPIAPVSEGNKLTLTCEISGGNPLPTIAWDCNGFTKVILTEVPPTDKVVSSIERVVTRLDNGKRCICTGHHPLWTLEWKVEHALIVYCK
ncbi:B-cell receptor CD22-like [Mytilus edulis]|uniref:B-cell receptor CD22-like n=1 Tax=Mytilus edulis TaxID=6550 RepID=UPI0039F08525